MLTLDKTLPAHSSNEEVHVPATAVSDVASTARNQFIAFFQNKGFTCVTDAMQQLKATYNRLTVRFSVSDPKIASDQGHAVCYLSFAPLNKRYKIAINNIQQAASSAYTYTLLEDTFVKTPGARHKNNTFESLDELLDAVFPRAASFTSAITLHHLFSFMF